MKLQAIEQLSQTVKRFFLFNAREPFYEIPSYRATISNSQKILSVQRKKAFYETPNSKKQRRVIINIFEDIH